MQRYCEDNNNIHNNNINDQNNQENEQSDNANSLEMSIDPINIEHLHHQQQEEINDHTMTYYDDNDEYNEDENEDEDEDSKDYDDKNNKKRMKLCSNYVFEKFDNIDNIDNVEKFDLDNLCFDIVLNILKYLDFKSLHNLWLCHNKVINDIIENYHNIIVNLHQIYNIKNSIFYCFLPKCKHVSGIIMLRLDDHPMNMLLVKNNSNGYTNFFANLVYIYNFPIFSERDLSLLQSPALLELSIVLTFYLEDHISFDFIKSKILRSLEISSKTEYCIQKNDLKKLPKSLKVFKCLNNVYFEDGKTIKYVSRDLEEFTGYLNLKIHTLIFHDITEQQKTYYSNMPPNLKKLTLIPTRMSNFDYNLLNYIPFSKNLTEFNVTTKLKTNFPIFSWIISENDMMNPEFTNLILTKLIKFDNLKILKIENERLRDEDLKYLPSSLQELEIQNAHFTPKVFIYLPKNLKILIIANNFRRYFPYYTEEQHKQVVLNPCCYMLPKNLQTLKLHPLNEFLVTKDQFNYYWQQLTLQQQSDINAMISVNKTISILDIVPKNVVHLELFHFRYPLQEKDFNRLNDKMTFLKMFEIDYKNTKLFRYCPRSLKELYIDCSYLNLEDFKYLPENLKILTIKCIDVKRVKKLLDQLTDQKYKINLHSYLDYDCSSSYYAAPLI